MFYKRLVIQIVSLIFKLYILVSYLFFFVQLNNNNNNKNNNIFGLKHQYLKHVD